MPTSRTYRYRYYRCIAAADATGTVYPPPSGCCLLTTGAGSAGGAGAAAVLDWQLQSGANSPVPVWYCCGGGRYYLPSAA